MEADGVLGPRAARNARTVEQRESRKCFRYNMPGPRGNQCRTVSTVRTRRRPWNTSTLWASRNVNRKGLHPSGFGAFRGRFASCCTLVRSPASNGLTVSVTNLRRGKRGHQSRESKLGIVSIGWPSIDRLLRTPSLHTQKQNVFDRLTQ